MKAYVLASKGVLVSDPSVRAMSTAQWYFEFAAIKNRERSMIKTAVKLIKDMAVNLMGLNAFRPKWPDGRLKSESEITEEEREAFLPLIAWVGHPEMLKKVSEQYTGPMPSDTGDMGDMSDIGMEPMVPPNDPEYDKLVEQIDKADGDMEPIIGFDPELHRKAVEEAERLRREAEQSLIPDRADLKVDI